MQRAFADAGILQQPLGNGIDAALAVDQAAAAPCKGGDALHGIASLPDGLLDEGRALGQLIGHGLGGQRLVMGNRFFHQLGFVVKQRDLGGGGTRIDGKNTHFSHKLLLSVRSVRR